MTDESTIYPKIGEEFANHGTVNHSANKYVRLGGYLHTNTIENGFVTLPNRARSNSAGALGSRRGDDFVPCVHGRCPEGSVRSC
jgi:hypothetical protein